MLKETDRQESPQASPQELDGTALSTRDRLGQEALASKQVSERLKEKDEHDSDEPGRTLIDPAAAFYAAKVESENKTGSRFNSLALKQSGHARSSLPDKPQLKSERDSSAHVQLKARLSATKTVEIAGKAEPKTNRASPQELQEQELKKLQRQQEIAELEKQMHSSAATSGKIVIDPVLKSSTELKAAPEKSSAVKHSTQASEEAWRKAELERVRKEAEIAQTERDFRSTVMTSGRANPVEPEGKLNPTLASEKAKTERPVAVTPKDNAPALSSQAAGSPKPKADEALKAAQLPLNGPKIKDSSEPATGSKAAPESKSRSAAYKAESAGSISYAPKVESNSQSKAGVDKHALVGADKDTLVVPEIKNAIAPAAESMSRAQAEQSELKRPESQAPKAAGSNLLLFELQQSKATKAQANADLNALAFKVPHFSSIEAGTSKKSGSAAEPASSNLFHAHSERSKLSGAASVSFLSQIDQKSSSIFAGKQAAFSYATSDAFSARQQIPVEPWAGKVIYFATALSGLQPALARSILEPASFATRLHEAKPLQFEIAKLQPQNSSISLSDKGPLPVPLVSNEKAFSAQTAVFEPQFNTGIKSINSSSLPLQLVESSIAASSKNLVSAAVPSGKFDVLIPESARALPGSNIFTLESKLQPLSTRRFSTTEQRQFPGVEIIMGALISSVAVARVRPKGENGRKNDVELQLTEKSRVFSPESGGLPLLPPQFSGFKKELKLTKRELAELKLLNASEAEKQEASLKKQQTGGQASNQKRRKYRVGPADSLDKIAEKHFNQKAVAYLIADINFASCKETLLDGERVVELYAGQLIELPSPDEVESFLQKICRDAAALRKVITLVTNVSENSVIAGRILGSIV